MACCKTPIMWIISGEKCWVLFRLNAFDFLKENSCGVKMRSRQLYKK